MSVDSFSATAPLSKQSVPHLEGQVLQEVGCPIRLIGLGPASSIDENADGRSLHIRRVLGRNLPHPQQSASYPSSLPPLDPHPEKATAEAAAVTLTVSPFDSVVEWVMAPRGAWEASDLVSPGNLLGTSKLLCLRRPEVKAVRASRAAAIGEVDCGGGGRGGGGVV